MDIFMADRLVIIIIAVLVIFAVIVLISILFGRFDIELPEKRAGRMGEKIATTIISEILHDEDILLTNVGIYADGKETELDNVIINTKGVFIIEVKNYSGQLIGDEEDAEWIKNKVTEAGYLYQKTVRNPIKQVKRQEYLVSKLLKDNGIHVWIKGYVFLLERNSPVRSSYILDTQKDIEAAIHPDATEQMDVEMVESVKCLLMNN